MRYILLVLAILGVIAASLALREHYREYGDAPCDINEHWDCGVVNHSHYAMLVPTFAGLAFSLYLANIEKNVLGVWCIYCVFSLGVISLMSLLTLGAVVSQTMRRPSGA